MSNNKLTTDQLLATIYFLTSFKLDISKPEHLKLVQFVEENQISLAIEAQDLIIIKTNNVKTAALSPVLTLMKICGCNFIYAKKSAKTGKLSSVVKDYTNLLTGEKEGFIHVSDDHVLAEVATKIGIVKDTDLINYIMGKVYHQLGNLDGNVIAKLFSLLYKRVELDDNNVISVPANYGGMTVDFNNGHFSVGSTELEASKFINVGNTKVNSKAALFFLCAQVMKLGVAGEIWKAEGLVNKIPGLWNQESGYGIDLDNANKKMKENGAKFIKLVHENGNRFPYYSMQNSKMVIENIDFSDCPVIFTDKVGSKTLYDEDAANCAGIFAAIVSYKAKDGTVKTQKGQISINDTGAKLDKETNTIELSAKFTNRISQSWSSQCSDLVDDNNNSVIVKSKYGNKVMSTGQACFMYGQMVKIACTNKSAGSGSGVAQMNPDFSVKYSLDKTLKSRATITDCLGDVWQKYNGNVSKDHANFYMFVSDLEEVMASIPKDKVFGPGDTIAVFDYGSGVVRPLFKNTSYNQYYMVTGFKAKKPKITGKDFAPTHVNLQLKVKAIKKTQFAKFRTAGLKATTVVSQNQTWFDSKGKAIPFPADIIYNNETRKGNVTELVMYAHHDPNIKTGIVEGDDRGCRFVITYKGGKKKTINLMKPNNEVAQWVNENTQDLTVQIKMPRTEYDFSLKAAQSAGNVLAWTLIAEDGDHVTIEEKVQCLVGYVPLNFEISTADEAVGASSLTPEMMAGFSLINEKLATKLYNEAHETRAAIVGLMEMATKYVSPNSYSFNPQSSDELMKFQEYVGNLNGLSDRQLISLMEKLFPNGLVLTTSGFSSSSKLVLYWSVIGKTMTFINGTADQISQEIVSVVRFLADEMRTIGISGIDSTINSAISKLSESLRGWLIAALNSSGLIKKLSRSSKCLVNGKVRTVYNLSLTPDSDGLPKVLVNPKCGIAELLGKINGKFVDNYVVTEIIEDFNNNVDLLPLGSKIIDIVREADAALVTYFNPNLLHGEIVAAMRIPMFMPAFCKVVISTELEESYVGILPSVWARGNSGDSDGDGISLINCSSRDMTIEEAIEGNNSVVGLEGYTTIYEHTKLPFADFVEKAPKKDLYRKGGMVYATFLPHDDVEEYAYNTSVGHVGLRTTHINISNHYKWFVGVGYGIASAVTCWASIMKYNPNYEHSAMLERGILVAWTLIYEGLGLSGYSKAAARFSDVLRVTSYYPYSFDASYPYVYAEDENGVVLSKLDDKVKKNKLELKDSISFLLDAVDLPDTDEWRQVMENLVCFNHYRMQYGKIDRGQMDEEKLEKMDQFKLTRVALIGMFRHMGRGVDPSTGLEIDAAVNQDIDSYVISCLNLVKAYDLYDQYLPKDSWLYKLYINYSMVVSESNNFLAANAEVE